MIFRGGVLGYIRFAPPPPAKRGLSCPAAFSLRFVSDNKCLPNLSDRERERAGSLAAWLLQLDVQ